MLLICHSTAFGSQAALEVWIGFQLLLHMIQEVLHREALTSLPPKNNPVLCSPLLPMTAFRHPACSFCFSKHVMMP